MNFLIEASGSLTSSYLIQSIQDAGFKVFASDINADIFGKYLADGFIKMPRIVEKNSWNQTVTLVEENDIQVVVPSLDEILLKWSEHKETFFKKNIHVIISSPDTLKVCQDKWETYLFFKDNDIPTPETSLDSIYPLIKPRTGRGSAGIFMKKENEPVSMEGNISQELIYGTEYTIDVFCDCNYDPVYIVPRQRLNVKEGKSLNGIVVKHPKIESYVKKICSATAFIGPINIQCFEDVNGNLKFIEINPRIGGGMALGFAATENWIPLIVSNLIEQKPITPTKVQYGLKMMRYYNEIFTLE